MLGKIELRLGVPDDFKIKNGNQIKLKEGAIFFVADKDVENKMQGCFVLSYAYDLIIFKEMLQAEMIYVPIVDESLVDFLEIEM